MRTVLGIAAFVSLLAYPAVVYYGLTRLGARQLALVLVPLLLAIALARLPRERRARPCARSKVPAVMARPARR